MPPEKAENSSNGEIGEDMISEDYLVKKLMTI